MLLHLIYCNNSNFLNTMGYSLFIFDLMILKSYVINFLTVVEILAVFRYFFDVLKSYLTNVSNLN